jgi:MinD superfamily P-loop ATPase
LNLRGILIRIAIASGKGGTGKTLVATSLAALLRGAQLVDLDVEEPNCYIFFKGGDVTVKKVFRPVPQINEAKCTHCGKCSDVCEYHAIAVLRKQVLVFEDLCHGCGACTLFCPEGAVSEKDHYIGDILRQHSDAGADLLYGMLRVREASAAPLIRQVKRDIDEGRPVIVDCPPGTACTAVESIRGADLCILVTEPTPFGMHDLKLSLEMTRKLKVQVAVFINKTGLRGPDVAGFCEEQGVKVIGELPYERMIAEAYSKGETIGKLPKYRHAFEALAEAVRQEAKSA